MWINSIQKAIDYVENHLEEKIDFNEAAKQASSSVFYFQRVFTMLCGCTLGDYIRMRRLSLAGYELIFTDSKVIDIALKYGYDSPESFSRAFVKFHGITPSMANKTGKIKSFSGISLKLTITGGDTMDYRIEKREPVKVLCKRQQVRKPIDDFAVSDIYSFWDTCKRDGTIEKLCSLIPDDTPIGGLLGICFSSEYDSSGK